MARHTNTIVRVGDPLILNNRLKWDGSHLGSYIRVITHRWSLEGIHYYGITLPVGWSQELPSGVIYCTATCTKDLFPCIVEGIKDVFGLPRRGVHRITIDYRQYLIYYVPISIKGEVIWETPLSRLKMNHSLRKDPFFRKEVQKVIAFCDILALCRTGEPSIRIRPGSNGAFIPVSINESATSIIKDNDYDYSVLTKTLFSKWFGEETAISDIVKQMVYSRFTTHRGIPAVRGTDGEDLAIISAEIRGKVESVIKQYDACYIWYSNFIVDRMSRYLLPDT